jgi:hypothetical protein
LKPWEQHFVDLGQAIECTKRKAVRTVKLWRQVFGSVDLEGMEDWCSATVDIQAARARLETDHP